MCSDPKRDSHRFADLVREHLQREGSEPPARFVKWEKQVRKRRAPADPLAPRKRGKENRAGGQDDAALVALIRWAERGAGLWDLCSFELYASDVTTDGLGCQILCCPLSIPCACLHVENPDSIAPTGASNSAAGAVSWTRWPPSMAWTTRAAAPNRARRPLRRPPSE